MDREARPERDEQGPSGASAGSRAYEPPAIAWEEAFEPLAATSCGLTVPFEPSCLARPQV
jgi:hypothetical protein